MPYPTTPSPNTITSYDVSFSHRPTVHKVTDDVTSERQTDGWTEDTA